LPDHRLIVGTSGNSLWAVRTPSGPAQGFWPTFQQNSRRTGRAESCLEIPDTEQVQKLHGGEPLTTTPFLNLAGRTLMRAELFCGTNLVAVATNAPFTLTWTNASTGSHDLFVRGIDNTGYAFWGGPVTVVDEPLKLTWALGSSNEMSLQINALPGRSYHLESTTNFTDWKAVESGQSPAPDQLRWNLDPGAPPVGAFRAYRVRLGQ
jgi:hypothetical protein